MKELYFEAEMDIVEFDCENVIATSSAWTTTERPIAPGEDVFL